MDLQIKDRVIFLAGASRGIGLSIAEACLAEGAKVALTARSPGPLEETRKELGKRFGADKVWSFAGDMRETAVIEDALAQCEKALGPIYGAIANVGIHPCPREFEIDDETWDAGFKQNLDSAYRLARGALRRMIPRKNGTIVFISSLAGVNALGAPLTYSVSKAAINHLTKDLTRRCGSDVRINAVAPGYIKFPGSDWDERVKGPEAAHWLGLVDREIPLKRFGKVEEVSSLVVYLLSPLAGFINGAVLSVDGGQSR